MKRYIVLTLTAIVLISIAVEPVLAQMGGSGWQQMAGKGNASEMMKYVTNIRVGQGMQGIGFMYSAGNAYGEYVTFTIDNQTGNILDYGLMGTPLFNISIANFNYRSTSTLGSLTQVSNTDGSTLILINDNPSAIINIMTTKAISVTFTLSENATATEEGDLIRIESGSIVGNIIGRGDIKSTLSGKQVKIDIPPFGGLFFRAAPANMPMFDQMHSRIAREIVRNRMGMEIAFSQNGTYNSINYTAMQLMVQVMGKDRIRLLVNATEPSGRVIFINLDNTSLVIGPDETLGIDYDGQRIQCVNDSGIVFNGTDSPLCWISPVQDRARAQLLIYIPHFSEHTIDIVVEATPAVSPTANATITTTAQPAATTRAPGFGLMLSLAALLTWVLLAKRRKNN